MLGYQAFVTSSKSNGQFMFRLVEKLESSIKKHFQFTEFYNTACKIVTEYMMVVCACVAEDDFQNNNLLFVTSALRYGEWDMNFNLNEK